jgi:hypothetical protein
MEDRPLADVIETLPEKLRELGYRTAAFTTHGDWLSREMGLAQGFLTFESRYQNAERNTEDVLDWLDSPSTLLARLREESLFLFLHYYDVHSDWNELPYESEARTRERLAGPEPIAFSGCRDGLCSSSLLQSANRELELLSEREVEWIRGLYAAGVADMDLRIGELFDALWRRGLFAQSWIILTSDHGEEFREHGRMLHSQPYRETSRVPLIIRPPGGRLRQDVEGLVGLVDVMPTVLEITGAETSISLQGESLLRTARGEAEADRSLHFDFYDPGEADWLATRDAHYSFVSRNGSSEVELFDTRNDPHERMDLASSLPEIVARMLQRARTFRAHQLAERQSGSIRREISVEETSRLRALGYGK